MKIDPALAFALREADNGTPVFPIRAMIQRGETLICNCQRHGGECKAISGKHPQITGWQNLATTDPEQIAAWSRQFPGCNWGGLTGERAGRLIIEVDPRKDGVTTLRRLESQYGPLSETRTFRSGSGGPHFVFAWPPGVMIRNSADKWGPGVDVRGHHGMGVLPGSRHRNGNLYELVEDLDQAELPPRWVEVLASKAEAPTRQSAYTGPRALFPPILENCSFMRHARDDAASLGEEEWFTAIGIAANCENGIEHAHALSEDYPEYCFEETQSKAERAVAESKPRTCERIAALTGGKWCESCVFRGRIKSPIVLGHVNRPVIVIAGRPHSKPVRSWIGTHPLAGNDPVRYVAVKVRG